MLICNFLNLIIINKGTQPWTRTYISLVSDPDLGYANDDYIGCDTLENSDFVIMVQITIPYMELLLQQLVFFY